MSVKELKFDNDYITIRFVNDNTLIIKLDIPCASLAYAVFTGAFKMTDLKISCAEQHKII